MFVSIVLLRTARFLSGGDDGARMEAQREGTRTTRFVAAHDGPSGCLPQRDRHLDERQRGIQANDCGDVGVFGVDRRSRPQTVSLEGARRTSTDQASRSPAEGHAGLSSLAGQDRAGRPADAGVRFYGVDGAAAGRLPEEANRAVVQRGSSSCPSAPGRLRDASPQAHLERQTRRGGPWEGETTAGAPKKKRCVPMPTNI